MQLRRYVDKLIHFNIAGSTLGTIINKKGRYYFCPARNIDPENPDYDYDKKIPLTSNGKNRAAFNRDGILEKKVRNNKTKI